MKQQDIIQLIKNPQSIGPSQLGELQGFTAAFPFFQTAQLLYTIGLKEHLPQHYQKQLRKTAIIANNRRVLYELLQAPVKAAIPEVKQIDKQPEPDVQQEVKQEPQKQALSNVTVTSDEVKVIYITTPPVIEKVEKTEKAIPENKAQQELEVLREIENETTPAVEEHVATNEHKPAFNEEKLNKEIELEISRQLVDSYVQTEVIRTPELHQEKQSEHQQEETGLQGEPGSFMDWLQKVKKGEKAIEKAPETPKTEQKEPEKPQEPSENQKFEEKRKLIDKIIEADPGKIRMSRDKFFTATQDAKQSLLENEHLITETLAKIYALQGNISKAVRAYEILSLKFPQKSAYFASLIEKLKTK